MTYQDFLNTLVSPITSFVSWLSMVANSLINNYFFITMLGIVLFISLVWLVYDIIDWFLYSHINDYDDFNNRLYDYKVFKKVQATYLDQNRNDEFDYKYNLRVLNEQVFFHLLHNNKDLVLLNRNMYKYLDRTIDPRNIVNDISSPITDNNKHKYDILYNSSKYFNLNGDSLISKINGSSYSRYVKDPSGKYDLIDLYNGVYVDKDHIFQNFVNDRYYIIDSNTGNIIPGYVKDPSGKYDLIDLYSNVYVDKDHIFENFIDE